jgi:outer membrane protein OmpA-like peptidoglycan-associated protein
MPIALSAIAGCGSSTPAELQQARSAYDEAARGPANQYAPADLQSARQMLQIAERVHDDQGDTDEAKDIAYAAQRRAQLADARGRTAQALQQRNASLAEAQSMREQQTRVTAAELQTTRQQLENERRQREDAEQRAAQAASELAAIAKVKQDARGLVITLPGGVLFASGKSELRPEARSKLDQVATALRQETGAQIRVEGYTDAQGSRALNDRLSTERAEAVRDYLVSRGISADRITAQGFGPDRPIADNKTAEGRADNRRVEIVVMPPHAPERPKPATPP